MPRPGDRPRTLRILAGACAVPLALAACGGSDESGGGSSAVTSLRVLDYYSNEPDKTVIQKTLDACGQQIGAKIER